MSWFKKEEEKQEEKQELKFGKVEEKVEAPKVEDKRTPQEHFNAWYASLSPADKKKVDHKLEKNYLRNGTPVLCKCCGKAGGTLRKLPADGGYEHVVCP